MGRIHAHGWYIHGVIETIKEARRNHRFITIEDLLNALRRTREDAYDAPSSSHALRLAEGLRMVLTVEELVVMSRQVKEELARGSDSTVWRIEKAIGEAAQSTLTGERRSTPISELVTEQSGPYRTRLIEDAIVLQALGWAIQPPEPPMDAAIP